MAVLLRPKHTLIKPPTRAVIDPTHPLAASMRTCFMFTPGGGLPADIGSSPFGSAFDGSPTWTQTPAGVGLAVGSGSGVHGLDTSYNLSAGDFTVRIVHIPTSLSAFAAIFEKANGASREVSFFVGSSGQLSFWQISGTSGSPSIPAMTVGKVWDLVIVRRLPGALTVYVNGVSQGDVAAGAATGTGGIAGSRVALGPNVSGGGQAYNGTYISSQTWTRALSASEIARLYSEPYGFLQPQTPRRSLWAVPAQSTVDLTLTDTPGSLRAAGGTQTLTLGLTAIDTPTAARAHGSTDTLALGVTYTDTPTAGRAGTPPSLLTLGLTLSDTAGNARTAGTRETLLLGVTFTDIPGAVRGHDGAQALTLDLILADQAGAARAAGTVDTLALDVPNVRGYSRSTLATAGSSSTSLTSIGSSRTTLATVGSSTAGVE